MACRNYTIFAIGLNDVFRVHLLKIYCKSFDLLLQDASAYPVIFKNGAEFFLKIFGKLCLNWQINRRFFQFLANNAQFFPPDI